MIFVVEEGPPEDFSTEDFNLSNHSSFLQPSNIPFSSISASLISPETARYETDPLFQLDRRCAYNTPMPELDGNQELALQSCQCTPEKLRRLLEQVLAEKSLNKISVCCGSPIEIYQGPRRTRFLDIKCSPCWPTTAISERMKCGPNPSINCDCNKLSDLTGQTLKNIATSPLLSSDEAVNIGVQDTDLSRHFNLGEHPITIDSFGYQRGTKANGGHSVVKVKGTYTQADKQRKNLPLNPLHQYENISINSNNNDNIKTNLVHTMSDLNFSVHTQPPKPNINVRTNIVEGQMNSGYLRPIEHYDNISMFSKTNDQIMSNLIRALSGFKYSQKQPPCQQYPKPNVTFEEFLKHCATVKKSFIHALPPSGIMKKPIKKPNLNETQKRIGITPYTLHEAPNKLKEQKVKEDPAQGFKLSISRKSSDFTGHTNNISIT